MVDQTNSGFISTFSTSASNTLRLKDEVDSIHSSIISTLNIATAGNRVISGFTITQGSSAGYTTYGVTTGKILRNGLLVEVSGATVSPQTIVNTGFDHYSVLVVKLDGTTNSLEIRDGAKSGFSETTVSVLSPNDIPIAVIKNVKNSGNSNTSRPVQWLGYTQTNQGLSIINSSAETLRINTDGTITKGGATLNLPTSSGTIARIEDVEYASAIPNATASQTGLATSTQIAKLDGIETNATADQTKSDINTLYNWSTDPESGATADQTDTEIKNAYHNVVSQVTDNEKNAGTSTAIRVFAPKDIKDIAVAHAITANTDVDVSVANLKTKLNSDFLGNFTIGTQSDDVATFTGGVTIGGDLIVSGTTTTVNSGTINLADNFITLNSDITGTPNSIAYDSGLEVERGSGTNVFLKWNEASDRWTFTNDGSAYYNIPISTEYNNYTHPTNVVTNLDTSGAEVLDTLVTDSTGHITAMTKRTLTKANLGLGNVENTAISSFAGTSNITTVGTITTGTWQGTAIATAYIANSAITTAKINDDAITADKIANGVIGNTAIASDANIAQDKINGLSTSLAGKEPSLTIGNGLTRTGSTLKININDSSGGLGLETGIDRTADFIMFDDGSVTSGNPLRRASLVNIFDKLIASDIPALAYLASDTTAIVNANIAANAAISSDKLADGTNNKLFTATLKSKLDGIANGAEVNVKSNWNETSSSADSFIENKPTIPSGNQIIDWTADQSSTNIHAGNYINTEYSVGDGGLTQVNFTTARSNKLDGIADNANNFSLTTGAVTNDHLAGSIAQSKITNLTTDLANMITDLTDLNINATSTEINVLDGISSLLTSAHLSHLVGVNSNIQGQLDNKLDGNEIKAHTLTATMNNANTAAVIKLTDVSGGTSILQIDGGTSINTSVGNAGQLVLDALSAVASIAFTEGLLTLTYADGSTLTTTLPDATTSAHGLMTDTQFDQLAANVSKLANIEANADVTDTANVTAAGALMDSELTDLAGVKGVTISTLQVKPSEGAFADGDKTKLDSIEASATADQTAAEIRTLVESASDSNVFTDADHSKLNAIEASATADQTASEITALLNDVASYSLGTANSGIITVNHDLTVAGDLIISGDTTTVNSNTVNIGDSIITLNSDETGTPSQDAGIEIERGSSTNKTLFWDESEDEWTIGAERFKAGSFEGDGSLLTALNGSQITSGTIAAGRVATLNQDTTGNAATATKITSITNSNIVQLTETQTLTNKTINASNNTLSNISNSSLSNSAITIDGTSVSLGGSISTSNTQLTTEQVQDIVGDMFASNTETRISATYVDGGDGVGKINLVVDDMTANDNTFRTVTAGGNTLGSSETLAFTAGSNVTISELDGAVTIASTDTNTFRTITAGGNTLEASETLAFTAGTGITIAESGGAVTITNSVTDTNTQNVFASSFVDSSDDIILRLTKSGASSGTQDIKFVAGSNVTLTHTDANNITIASTDTNTQLSQAQVRDFAGGMFTGNTETFITATYQTGDDTVDLVVPVLDEDNFASDSASHLATQQSIKAYVDAQVSSPSGTVTVSDSTANTNFPVVFHNESNALLDDTGALRYNPSTGTLLVPNLVVAGTSTTVDTVTMEAANAIVFEGATPDTSETTLTITDPTADRTITLPDASGTVLLNAGVQTITSDTTGLVTGLVVTNTGSAGNSATVSGIEIKNGTGTDSSTHIEQDAFGITRMYTGQGAKNEFLHVSADATIFTIAGDLKLGGNDIKASDGTTAITTSGADVTLAGNLTLAENKKIYFDSTDTYIYADTDSSEDLHIGSDGHIELEPDDDLIVKTGSTEYVRFDGSEQRVGIGTTSPSSNLEVAGNTTGNVQITIDNDNTAGLGTYALQEDGATTGIFQYRGSTNGTLPNTVRVGSNVAGGSLAFTYAGGTTGMYIKGSDGNVGIGTISPDYTLDVAGNIGVDQYIYHNGDGDTYINMADDDFRIVVGNDLAFHYDESGTSVLHLSYNGEADINIGNGHFFFGGSQGSYDTKMGIGTVTPSVNLHVNGGSDNELFRLESTDDLVTMSMKDNDTTAYLNAGGGNAGHLSLGGYAGTHASNLNINVNTGKVGIGTNAPSAPLHIVSATTSDLLRLEGTDAGNSSAPDLVLYRNTSSPADGDFVGIVDFKANDDGGSEKYYARIGAKTRDVSAGSEDGQLFFMPAVGGSTDANNSALKLDALDGAVFNEGGYAAWDFRVESDTNANMFFVDSGNNRVGIGTNSPSETLDVNGNTKVTGNVILAADNNKLILGTGGDLEIFHDGTNSYIDSDTGLLRLDGNDGVWLDDGGSNIMRITNSSVLSYRGLDITGDTVHTGNLHLDADNNQLILGAGSDLKIYHDGSNSYIDEEGTGSLIINSSQVAIKSGADAAENMATFITDGAVTLYHNNVAKLATSADGVTVTGTLSATSKSFVIPHPTEQNKTLRHGSLEGPEHGVYVRGTLETEDSTEGFIELPDYWLGLVDEDTITVQLTGKGRFQRLYVAKIEDNKVYVENEKMHDIDCYYFIQAERKDIRKMVVEY